VDTFLELEIPQLEACWKATLRPLIVARHVDNASRYDVLAVDQDGRIRAFLARGAAPSGLINAGCYVLPRDLFAGFEARAKFSFEQDYLPAAVRAREFGTFVTRARFIDIGVPEDYERAQSLLADLAR
jgi:D-glycero-alpha-D-manno-heptose 1-phosphate guanylyltransferase